MKRGIRVLTALTAVLAAGLLPALAVCPASSPIGQGGVLARPDGGLLTAAPLAGYWWELGLGDPALAAGNDQGATEVVVPPAADAVWITRSTPRGLAALSWDWFNGGTDGCLSGGSGAGVMVAYLIDGGDDYAIVAATGVSTPIPSHDFDTLVTSVGPNGNDVPFVSRNGIRPQLSNVVIVDAVSVTADVAPAIDGVNLHTDGPAYAGVVDTSGLTFDSGPCPHDTGCTGVTLPRDAAVCWVGGADAVAKEVAGPALCVGGVLDGFPCTPGLPTDPCLAFAGTCPPGPSVVTPFGPPLPGDCTLIGGPTIDDNANPRAVQRNRSERVFTWTSTEFAVSHYNIFASKRGETFQLNSTPIRSEGSGGATVEYVYTAQAGDLKGAKEFQLQLVRTDGQELTFDFPHE